MVNSQLKDLGTEVILLLYIYIIGPSIINQPVERTGPLTKSGTVPTPIVTVSVAIRTISLQSEERCWNREINVWGWKMGRKAL